MIYVTVCIGAKWNSEYKSSIQEFSRKNELYILTDFPELYDQKYTFKYERKVFSYFEKIKFIFKIIEGKRSRVTYIDANKLDQYNTGIIYNDQLIYTGQILSVQHVYKYFLTPSTLTDIGLIFDKIGIKNLNIKYPREHILSVPYIDSIEGIIKDLNTLQPYLEKYYNEIPRTQYLKRYSETGVGYAEGWSLVAISIKYGIGIKLLDWKKKSII